ncbi:hypothetical protein MKW94_018784 [Papaver nudicaule]|uniref:Antimicrobial peptide 1 n=1 Tax=Papaver nudicaule TaxID=74823 RepID=A0AA41V5J7_PAPNU|nr:hypothetical protein [Papaver nudicaule]
MATYLKSRSSNFVLVVLMALVFVALVSDFANASSLTVWRGPGCDQNTQVLRNCGCSAINLRGGYSFVFNGQPASLFNTAGCRGIPQTTLKGDARMCSGFGWKSMFIQCKF